MATCLVAAPSALAAFPPDAPIPGHGPEGNPAESVRANTPNDPDFDRCESDNAGGPQCGNVFGEQNERFGFAPSPTQATALYHNPTDPHVQQLMARNTLAGRLPLGQVPGASEDQAWKYTTGDPDVRVAILDTGIRWENNSLRKRIALNRGELPKPQNGAVACAAYDCNADGLFNVDDYSNDDRVKAQGGGDPKKAGDDAADGVLDASDLIATFSDSTDADSNGYVDDIAGWDFFNDDNDPFDASSYSSANNHGSGRASDAAEQGNDADGSIGVCPRCSIVPMRVWDTFVVDTNNFAQAVSYAADNHVDVVEGAVGGLFNSGFARKVFDYAYRKGTFLAIVSSDLNTADHNFPTYYDEAMQVQGTVADVHGLGSDNLTCLPSQAGGACAPFPAELTTFLQNLGLPSNVPVSTWYRNSGTTQYGGHAHIVMPAVTGSVATGQASGAAGLLISYAKRKQTPLEPNEVKQLLTLTAQDIVPENTLGVGTPDPAQVGWDQHFGYGLPDLGLAMQRIDQGKIPPQALITGPPWFAPLNVAQQHSATIAGRVSARRAAGFTYRLQWAPGIEPAEGDFQNIGGAVAKTAAFNGDLGTVNLDAVRAALDSRPNGGATVDATAPGKGPGDKDPNEPAFTVRVQVTDSAGNRGEDRKVLFAYRDTSLQKGWARYTGTGGEASPRLFDLNGDNKLDVVQADSSGKLRATRFDGSPVPGFNGGRPLSSRVYSNVHGSAPVYSALSPPREVLRTPAIGDIDGDKEPEIVDSAGEHVYAWRAATGRVVPGFPVRLDPAFSLPADTSKTNHVKRGFSASPSLSDLNGDGKLDIVIPGLDQHVYAWDGQGHPLPGFPSKLQAPGTNTNDLPGAESINTAAVGDIDGTGGPDIVAPTNEVDGASPANDPSAGFGGIVTNLLAGAIGGTGRVYALNSSGQIKPGWPLKPGGLQPDALPFVGPGVDHALGDVDGDGKLDVIGNLATGDVTATSANGTTIRTFDSQPVTGEAVDKSKVLNLFENPIIADFDDSNAGLEVIKGGLTLNGLVNLGITVGQNLPYNHVVQAWSASTGSELPAFPQAVEDYQLLSSPAVADVSDAPGKELLVGTGLYYVRNINATGAEGTGWPKFTGGWNFATPAVGDADGDGKLDVASLTREGYGFLWKTNRPACGGNDEWWTSHHDEWNTSAYGTDTRPPGKVTHLLARRKGKGKEVKLSWAAAGDDLNCGQASKALILAAKRHIFHPKQGTPVGTPLTLTKPPGQTESLTVELPKSMRFVAVMYQDEAGNWGKLNNEPIKVTGTPPPQRKTAQQQAPPGT